MFYKKIFLFYALLLLAYQGNAQDCAITIQGQVSDEPSGSALSFVNVFIQETNEGATTDHDGNFTLNDVCPGHYHLIISHIGCESKKMHFDISRDTTLLIGLAHTSAVLGAVQIQGKRKDFSAQPNLAVSRQNIEDQTNRNLSTILENETGVSAIKNGSGIAKPVVHGLYGNRLTILNNGIVQSGQQWGNDHSPEIDPFAADKITVLKGVSAIEYGGGNLGSVILSEPKRVEREPHLHGQVNYIFETNGRGNTLSSRLEKYSPILAWRVTGTLKKYGDKKSADYFLNNTGSQEANFSLQLEKSWNDNLFIDFYASTFNTKLGILRGSQVSNLPDLELALSRDIPFNTEDNFAYDIDAPSQQVGHHLVKTKAKYYLSENKIFELILAGQINNRKEFDIRRNERSDIPSLSLSQNTFDGELKYSSSFAENWDLKIGNQNRLIDNTNSPDTGILPLIPDYISWRSGAFGTLSKKQNNLFFNLGLRYDFEHQLVLAISNNVQRDIIRYTNRFHNLSALFAMRAKFGEKQTLSWNLGYATRNPGINELYSSGLHQGVSGIEEGDINLDTEKAIKNTLEYKWFPNSDFTLNALAYYQHFQGYIFLNPTDEIRPTIRGAFPVFKYAQTDANIYGLDLSTQFTIGHALLAKLTYSYLHGQDASNDAPLIFMPPNNFSGSLTYQIHHPVKLTNKLRLENSEFEISGRHVFQQNNLLAEQDFVDAPESYSLVGVKISTNIISISNKIRFFAQANNLLNAKYRDYLNRQRYFADDLGRSITFGLNVKF